MNAILSLIRHALSTAGGYLVAKGTLDETSAAEMVGAIATILGVGWSLWAKRSKRSSKNQPGASSALTLALAAATACSLGCATTGRSGERDLAPIIKTAAYVGTHYALQEHPEWRPGFEVALQELAFIESQEQIDFATVLAIIHRLPVDELKGNDAVIIITSATILLSEYNGPPLSLDRVEQLRPIVHALRSGIELGLSN